MLDFRNRQSKTWKPKSRGTKKFKNFEGTHSSSRRLVKDYYVSGAWVRANMRKWLHTKVGKPVDMVYSEFLKDWKESYKGSYSPREYFDSYVYHSKEELCKYSYYHRYGEFYISNGILNEAKPRPWQHPSKTEWGRKQIAYNKAHFPKLTFDKDGPVFLGKFWVVTWYAPHHKAFVNVWLISYTKFGLDDGWMPDKKDLSRKEKSFLEDFVRVSVAGVYEYTHKEPRFLDASYLDKHYCYIARLSDIQQQI